MKVVIGKISYNRASFQSLLTDKQTQYNEQCSQNV